MAVFARVLVDRSAGRLLDYQIPSALESVVAAGSRVRVPVRQRLLLGTVVELRDSSDARGLREIHEALSDRAMIRPVILEMVRWMADYYCCSAEAASRTVLPQVVREAQIGPRELNAVEPAREISDEELEKMEVRSPRRVELLRRVRAAGAPVRVQELLRETGASSAVVQALVRGGWLKLRTVQLGRDPHGGEVFLGTEALALTAQQRAALEAVSAASRPVLLHGVTGSGKTEIYLQAIERTLAQGKQALVLVPEISLTPQTVERFKSRFSSFQKEVAVMHSHLSEGERYDEWHKIHHGQARIVIGARSAVFAPLERLGLIVVDEEHEPSYKQEEAPKYHARDLAVLRAKLEGCAIVLGSATPSLESYHNARMGKYELVRLTERIDGRKLPIIRVLDMRVQRRRLGNAESLLAAPLCQAIEERLAKREQTILFLNRRGYSTSLLCGECGHVCECPNCSIALTFHRDTEKVACHICGHVAVAPHRCPECQTPGIRYAGAGTQKVEESVRKLFPKARIARMDADTMTRKDAYRETLGAFRAGQIDLLVGTQMIAKGLDFPNVTLVGIINADLSLHLPDFRAGERTFQLLVQVAGRAGRGEMEGEVYVQTHTPFSPSIQFARQHDYEGFWEQEADFRQRFGYPPFERLLLLTVRSEKRELAEFTAQTLGRRLAEKLPEGMRLGEPVPAPLEKAKGAYRFHLSLRGASALKLSRHARSVLDALTLPAEVFISPDVDPQNLL
ncbi:MAG TPA: primosomal protein N' [Chthoniobacterales bacterium]